MAEGLQTGQEARLGRLLLVRPQQREGLHRPPLHQLHRPPQPQLPTARLMGQEGGLGAGEEGCGAMEDYKKTQKTWEGEISFSLGGKQFKSVKSNAVLVCLGWVSCDILVRESLINTKAFGLMVGTILNQ